MHDLRINSEPFHDRGAVPRHLVHGWVALPDDELLLQELRVYSAFTNQSGKLQAVAKDDLKRILGRSPDRLDAVLMACCGADTVGFSRCEANGRVPW